MQSCRSDILRFSEPVEIANEDGQHKGANEDSLVSLQSSAYSGRCGQAIPFDVGT